MSVPPAARRAGAAVNEPHTLSVGGWDGMDLTNSRLARGAKDKLYLAENLMYVGDGMLVQHSIQYTSRFCRFASRHKRYIPERLHKR